MRYHYHMADIPWSLLLPTLLSDVLLVLFIFIMLGTSLRYSGKVAVLRLAILSIFTMPAMSTVTMCAGWIPHFMDVYSILRALSMVSLFPAMLLGQPD